MVDRSASICPVRTYTGRPIKGNILGEIKRVGKGQVDVGSGIGVYVLVDGQGRLCKYVIGEGSEKLLRFIRIFETIVDIPACDREFLYRVGITQSQVRLIPSLVSLIAKYRGGGISLVGIHISP